MCPIYGETGNRNRIGISHHHITRASPVDDIHAEVSQDSFLQYPGSVEVLARSTLLTKLTSCLVLPASTFLDRRSFGFVNFCYICNYTFEIMCEHVGTDAPEPISYIKNVNLNAILA